ncbi:MAG: hypothetical protein R3D25_16005 [Geminicoccaceae bacterium]
MSEPMSWFSDSEYLNGVVRAISPLATSVPSTARLSVPLRPISSPPA